VASLPINDWEDRLSVNSFDDDHGSFFVLINDYD
jgi:hypothetical protein